MITNDILTELIKFNLYEKLEAVANRTCSTINVYFMI